VTSIDTKRCTVAYATAERYFHWTLELPLRATIADALGKARELAANEAIPWDSANIGIFGELRPRSAIPADGDRIEIYRPLANDPRERRRQRVRQRGGSGGGSSAVG